MGSEVLLSPVLQDVTFLSSNSLRAVWALPGGFLGFWAPDCLSLVLNRDELLVAPFKGLFWRTEAQGRWVGIRMGKMSTKLLYSVIEKLQLIFFLLLLHSKSVLFSLKQQFIFFTVPPSPLPDHISVLYSTMARVRNGINLHWRPSSSPATGPGLWARSGQELGQCGSRHWGPLGEFRGQRGKAKTDNKVSLSRLRGAELRMRDSRGSFVALCES